MQCNLFRPYLLRLIWPDMVAPDNIRSVGKIELYDV